MVDVVWTASEINSVFNAHVDATCVITGISIDTRTLVTGDLFVALAGPHHNGHAYLDQAFAAGAVAALVSRHDPAVVARGGHDDHRLILVEDSLAGLCALAAAARARFEGWVIAVTGSSGKTGVKENLRTVLAPSGSTHASVKSFNNHIGVPLTLARLPKSVDFAIFEMGMNHAGELSELSLLVKPDLAIITTINEAHIENLGSIEAIARAKAEIFDGMQGGSAIVPRDNPYCDILVEAARQRQCEIIGFGESEQSQAHLEKSRTHPHCSCVQASIRGQKITYKIAQPGAHHVSNSLAVLAAVDVVEADLALAGLALAQSEALEGRGQRHELSLAGRKITLIDESYNANPASMAAALTVLGASETGARRIAVLGDMAELGASAPQLHAALAEIIARTKIDRLYCCGPNMRHLFEAVPAEARGAYRSTPKELLSVLMEDLVHGDTVMVKGSNASQMGLVVEALIGAHASRGADTSNNNLSTDHRVSA